MTDKLEVVDAEDDDCVQEVFDKISNACEGYEFGDVAAAAIDMVVACVKESGDDDFANGVVTALLEAAHFLSLTGAADPDDQSGIIQLN